MNSIPHPHFLCVGAQKSGTTSLYHWLSSHPDVYLPAEKETHFFTLHYELGFDWYSNIFTGHQSKTCGDITPYYLFHPLAAERIYHHLPWVKIIILLRDPVERAISGLYHSIRLGYEHLDPMQALLAEALRMEAADVRVRAVMGRDVVHQEQSYLSRSRYEIQLGRYESLFSSEQIFICRSEDLFQPDNTQTLKYLLDFLGLTFSETLPPLPRTNVGFAESTTVPAEVRQWLRQELETTYHIMQLHYQMSWRA